jgi:diguanylate cyclase (GGDEF)-like protein
VAQSYSGHPGRVLVVEDDPDITRMLIGLLKSEGLEVVVASNGEEALEAAHTAQPDVILLDLMIPKITGIEVCKRLRSDPMLRRIGIIMLTARTSTEDAVEGLRSGADDYVTKPFDPDELMERLRSVLRRSLEMVAANPLSGLPGNRHVKELLVQLIASQNEFALMHVDVDHFKAFNDHYGVLRGDLAIKLLARCVSEAVAEHALGDAFVGHIGGDDFVAIVKPDEAEPVARDLIHRWDRSVRGLYDQVDLEKGFIEIEDRRGELLRFPPMTISIGIVSSAQRVLRDHLEAADAAGELKEAAKRAQKSSFAVDRRTAESIAADKASARAYPRRLWEQLAAKTGPPTVGRVLIVDDDHDIRFALRLQCELQGFHVVGEAADGEEAFALAAGQKPDVVLLDYGLPGVSGEDVASRLREICPEVCIVAFSGILDRRPPWADAFLRKTDISEVTRVLLQVRQQRGAVDPTREGLG